MTLNRGNPIRGKRSRASFFIFIPAATTRSCYANFPSRIQRRVIILWKLLVLQGISKRIAVVRVSGSREDEIKRETLSRDCSYRGRIYPGSRNGDSFYLYRSFICFPPSTRILGGLFFIFHFGCPVRSEFESSFKRSRYAVTRYVLDTWSDVITKPG